MHIGKAAWVFACALLTGCASFHTLLDNTSATAVARDAMRSMRTDRVELYYPDGFAEAGRDVANQLQFCMQQLEAHLIDQSRTDPAVVIYHRGELNNAYVSPPAVGSPQFMVLPMHEGLEFFNLLNLGLVDVPHVSCHEALHYITFQQVHGFWDLFNDVFGTLVSPNYSLETWFHEGMATYYESRLAGPIGRPESSLWNGMFDAGAASLGGALQAGFLSAANRELGAFSGVYLVGQHFVQYLADTYGELALWRVIDKQSRSFFSPFGVTLRFAAVYGKTIGGLFDEWVATLSKVSWRQRPMNQATLVPPVGYWARMATCPAAQLVAVAYDGVDDVPRLDLYDGSGRRQWSQRLTDILPGRQHVTGSSKLMSGMEFTGDCRSLYFTAADVDRDAGYNSSLWRLDSQSGRTRQGWREFYGVGGSIDKAGERYAYVRLTNDQATMTVRHLRTGVEIDLPHVPGTTSLGAPAFSPDGQWLAFSARTVEGFNLFVQPLGGAARQLTADDGFNYAPRWLSDGRLMFVRNDDGHVQVFTQDLHSVHRQRITDAPHALMDPGLLGDGRVAFLNADGWRWSIDTIVLPPAATAGEIRRTSLLAHSDPDARPSQQMAPAPKPGNANDTWVPPVAHVYEDLPYSPTDHLWAPTARTLSFQTLSGISPATNAFLVGAQVLGQDRLGFHQYALSASYSPAYVLPGFSLSYLNNQLAPWQLQGQLQLAVSQYERSWMGSITASRPFWTHLLLLSVQSLDTTANPYIVSSTPHFRLLGPALQLIYSAAESSPYGGTQRSLYGSLQVAGYPKDIGNTAGFVDVRLETYVVLPLPLSNRHRLSLRGRGRAVWGTSALAIRTGGVLPNSLAAYRSDGVEGTPGQTLTYYQATLGLVEAQRGYDDLQWLGHKILIGDATYTYPIIIDYGWHSFLYIMPSVFVQQVTLQAFATASWYESSPGYFAVSHAPSVHRAVGASAQLSTVWYRAQVPISLGYQVAMRFDTRPQIQQLVFLSLS